MAYRLPVCLCIKLHGRSGFQPIFLPTMRNLFALLSLYACLTLPAVAQQPSQLPSAPGRWPAAKANAWYAREPFLFGANYNPANAINELEFWQADTFDPTTIDKELGWAQNLGINTMRVFLHDLPYKQDANGFLKRIDTVPDRLPEA